MDPKKEGTITSGMHTSFWVDSVKQLSYSKLTNDLEADVVVVGGGLAGVSAAYCLTRAGKKVALVEDGFIGSGETGRTTAHLVTALDNRYYQLEKNFGTEKTKLIALSHAAAIDFVEQTVKRENISCEFERLDGYLFLHPSDKSYSLQIELEAAARAGINIFKAHEVLKGTGDSLCFPGQAQFHPLKYLRGLCDAITKKGGRIFTETHAEEIDQYGIKTADGFYVRAKHIVVATNTPVNNKFLIHSRQYAYRTYVVGALVKKGSVQKALYWDTGDFDQKLTFPPYHYVRLASYDNEHDLLISGGEDHPNADTSQINIPEEKRYERLVNWTKKYFPIEDIVYRWSGQVMEPMDGLAYIGRNPIDHDNIFIVTGDSGNGMTHCTIAGILLTDMITGRENPWEDIYRPSRFNLRSSGALFKEVIGALLANFKRDSSDEDHIRLSSVPKGEARQLDLHGERCGVYHDPEGMLHVVSTTCTHLKCNVKWNNDEKSWDCPCHGSRFTYDGKVMNGPANTDLPACSEKEILKEL